jgi:Replication-relaxation
MTGRPQPLTETDFLVLRAVNRFRYLTAAQLNRLLWPNNTRDKNRYAQLRLQRLVVDEYLLPLRGLPRPGPRVHALAWRGRKALLALGESVPSYYRPSELIETGENPVFLPHTLAVIDVLIAAERLTHDFDIRLTQLCTERELRRLRPRVSVPGVPGYTSAWQVTVIPDAVFSLAVGAQTQHFVLEVDRGTERQGAWRRKVAALTQWIDSPGSAALLPGEYVTVMVVTPIPQRREQLRRWTARELTTRGLTQHAGMFALSSASPVALTPQAFFMGEHWHPPSIGTPDSLIDL